MKYAVDPAVLSKVVDHATALELIDLIDRQIPAPDAHSRALTHAMLDAIGHRLALVLGLSAEVSVMLMGAICRLFHGDNLADKLGVQNNWTDPLLSVMIDANRFRFERVARDSGYRHMMQQQTLEAFSAIEAGLPDQTAYQAMARSLATQDLPSLSCQQ